MDAYAAMGSGEKNILNREMPNRKKHFQSIIACKMIKKGDILVEEMIGFKSPGIGLLKNEKNLILGKKAKRAIPKDSFLKLEDFEN